MLIFLPAHENSDPYLQILSKDLSYVSMRTVLATLTETEILVAIPRFSIESKVDLRTPLMRVSSCIKVPNFSRNSQLITSKARKYTKNSCKIR